jgi:hypothetical protein
MLCVEHERAGNRNPIAPVRKRNVLVKALASDLRGLRTLYRMHTHRLEYQLPVYVLLIDQSANLSGVEAETIVNVSVIFRLLERNRAGDRNALLLHNEPSGMIDMG